MSNTILSSPSNAMRSRRLSAIPVYERIEKDLRTRVASGEWGAGVMLPSRKELARAYNVDVNTLQRAIGPLVQDGTLRADGGRGTFVGLEVIRPAAPSQPALRDSRQLLTVGVIWKTDRDPVDGYAPNFWAPVVASIERTVSGRGGMCRSFDLGHESSEGLSLTDAVTQLLEQGVDGIISVIDRAPWEIENLLNDPVASRVPIVHAGGVLSRSCRLSVTFSSIDAGFHAASHLLRQGCRDLLAFSGCETEWVKQRVQGVLEAGEGAGLGADAIRVSIAAVDLYALLDRHRVDKIQMDLAYHAAVDLFKSGLPADGIVAVNDFNAFGFMQAASEAGYVAGTDYAIIGFDDFPESSIRGLTTLCPPLDNMGREAVAMLVRAIGEPGLTMRTTLPSDLVARASTMTYAPPESERQALVPLVVD